MEYRPKKDVRYAANFALRSDGVIEPDLPLLTTAGNLPREQGVASYGEVSTSQQ